MDLMEVNCEDGRWMQLTRDCIQWPALILAVLSLSVLLTGAESFISMILYFISQLVIINFNL